MNDTTDTPPEPEPALRIDVTPFRCMECLNRFWVSSDGDKISYCPECGEADLYEFETTDQIDTRDLP